MSDEVLVSDLSVCLPAEHLSSDTRKGCWRLVPYQTVDGLEGVLLQSACEAEAPAVRLPLGVSGRYDIFLGLWNPGVSPQSRLVLRLSDDPVRDFVANDADYLSINEVYWRTAELDGGELEIRQPVGDGQSGLAFVRLAPAANRPCVDDGQVRPLVAMEDGYFYGHATPESAEDIQDHILPYRDTDFRILLWGVGPGGDLVHYPTKVGEHYGREREAYPREYDRRESRWLQRLLAKGVDPLRVAVDYTHDCGLRIHGSCRMGAFGLNPPWDEVFQTRFRREHPECHCVDPNGSVISRMSYAYPAVRERMIALLLEVAAYGVDGINLNLVRGGPYAMYEPPLVEEFQKAHGIDPRTLDEDDPRWRAVQAGAMTGFLQELRAALDEAGCEKMSLSAVVYPDEATNWEFGLDVAAWIKTGLVSLVVPYYRVFYCRGQIDMDFFLAAAEGTQCLVCPNITNKRATAGEYPQLAADLYNAGAHGLAMWDTSARSCFLDRRDVIRRLGHVDWLGQEGTFDVRPSGPRTLKLIGGYRVDRYPPLYAY